MQTPNPKTMARILREALAERHVKLSHSASLELVAKRLGYNGWNVVVAQLEADKTRTGPTPHGSAKTETDFRTGGLQAVALISSATIY